MRGRSGRIAGALRSGSAAGARAAAALCVAVLALALHPPREAFADTAAIAMTAGFDSGLQAVDGPCRVKLRTGRLLDATSLLPADDTLAFWRVSLPGGGVVVLPQRELRSVERLASPPAPAEVASVALPPADALMDGESHCTCDPVGSARLVRWNDIARAAARKHGVDPALVRAIIAVESCGDPDAVSPKGAQGLMQLLPSTARLYGCRNLKDPRANVDAGAQHLAKLFERLGDDVDLVVAAYNAGEGAVAKAGGVPRYRETRNYVRDVKRYVALLSAPPEAM
jgi:soluble lytic murein transglycosylase-like protein